MSFTPSEDRAINSKSHRRGAVDKPEGDLYQPERRRLWPPGIRMQLSLWYMAVFTLLFVLFGIVFYLNLYNALTSSLDNNLQLRAQQIAGDISRHDGTIVLHDRTGELAGLVDADDDSQIGKGNVHVKEDPDFDVDFDALVRILNARGQVEYHTPAFEALTIPSTSISEALQGTSWVGTVMTHSGQMMRLYSKPLVDDGQVFGIVQVAQSLASLKSTLRSVVIELALIAPPALLLGAIGSYWLASRAFRPIERLTGTARTIKDGELHYRVPVPQTNDEVQRLALTFNEMIDRLEQSFVRQRRFTADASHELRTPVAAIRSMTEVALAQHIQDDECADTLRDVNAQAERLGHLISDLLTMARADEGHIHFEQELVRLDQLAVDVVATMEGLAAERGITLEVQTGKPAPVLGDEARLIQVMMNLLENALAYTNCGGRVTLTVEVTNTNVYLKVSDTGIGIAPEHLEHIFERFYRTDTARSRAAGGTGLGLSIVEWVVRMHHGTITVQSQPGEGSVFTVTLPLANKKFV